MAKLYYGDIIERVGPICPKNNMMSVMFTQTCKEKAILVEVKENKFADFDDYVLGKPKLLNLYAFNIGEKYVDPRSLVDIRELLDQKQKVK